MKPALQRRNDAQIAAMTTGVALLLATGCGGLSASAPDSPGADATPETLPLSISGVIHDASDSLLPGVKTCLHRGFSFGTDSAGPARLILPDAADCATSAADGSFRVSGARRNDTVILTFRREGFAPMLREIATRMEDITLPANENALMPVPLMFMREAADPGKGQIPFSVATAGAGPLALKRVGLEAESLTATPFSLLTAFDGPSERGPSWMPDAASTARVAVNGGFANVPSALYLVRSKGAFTGCTASTGLYGDLLDVSEPALIVPVLEGYVTAPVSISCAD